MLPLKTRSYSHSHSEYQGLLTFRIQYKVFKEGRKFILARLHLGEYLALASLSISDGMRGRLSQVDPYFQDFSTACFSRFSLLLINQHSKFELQMPPSKTFLFQIEGLHEANR